jgi:quercetin dioxygenase-like cupin family protein
MNYKIEQDKLNWDVGKVKGFLGKEFLNLDKGGVKLVKIEAQAVYPEHIHPDKTEYAFVVEGAPSFVINNEHFIGKVGDFFIFPSGIKHAIKNETNSICNLLIGSIKV